MTTCFNRTVKLACRAKFCDCYNDPYFNFCDLNYSYISDFFRQYMHMYQGDVSLHSDINPSNSLCVKIQVNQIMGSCISDYFRHPYLTIDITFNILYWYVRNKDKFVWLYGFLYEDTIRPNCLNVIMILWI